MCEFILFGENNIKRVWVLLGKSCVLKHKKMLRLKREIILFGRDGFGPGIMSAVSAKRIFQTLSFNSMYHCGQTGDTVCKYHFIIIKFSECKIAGCFYFVEKFWSNDQFHLNFHLLKNFVYPSKLDLCTEMTQNCGSNSFLPSQNYLWVKLM